MIKFLLEKIKLHNDSEIVINEIDYGLLIYSTHKDLLDKFCQVNNVEEESVYSPLVNTFCSSISQYTPLETNDLYRLPYNARFSTDEAIEVEQVEDNIEFANNFAKSLTTNSTNPLVPGTVRTFLFKSNAYLGEQYIEPIQSELTFGIINIDNTKRAIKRLRNYSKKYAIFIQTSNKSENEGVNTLDKITTNYTSIPIIFDIENSSNINLEVKEFVNLLARNIFFKAHNEGIYVSDAFKPVNFKRKLEIFTKNKKGKKRFLGTLEDIKIELLPKEKFYEITNNRNKKLNNDLFYFFAVKGIAYSNKRDIAEVKQMYLLFLNNTNNKYTIELLKVAEDRKDLDLFLGISTTAAYVTEVQSLQHLFDGGLPN